MERKTVTTNSKKLPAIAGISLILIILLLLIIFPCPTSSQYLFFRITISIACAGFATTISGFFRFNYKRVISAGGSIGIGLFVYIYNPALINTTDKCGSIDYTFFIEDTLGNSMLNSQGKLKLHIGNDKREENIDNKGSATFKQILLNKDSVSVELIAEGWQFTNGKKSLRTILKEEKNTILKIEHDNSLCCVIGRVRDNDSSIFLKSVKISIDIDRIVTETDENGRFFIEIPKDKQVPVLKLTAFKEGYNIWEDDVYPSTKQLVGIVMHKKK